MKARGFTLIELIIIMVLLAILAGSVSSYIGLGATMYTDAAKRERILSQSRFVGERMVRELRNAVPNSIEADNDCLRFVPVIASGVYDLLNGNSLTYKWMSNEDAIQVNDRIVIYPIKPAHVLTQTTSRNQRITSLSSSSNITLSGSFETESPARRFYAYRETVSYCKTADGRITRNNITMAHNVSYPKTVFDVLHPTLKRNALVNLHLQFGSGNHNDMFFNYEVHIPNVP